MPKWCLLFVAVFLTGCSLLPDVAHEARIHNPFPQLHRVAVLPFYNQSTEPTVDGEQVAIHYYTELQQVPGFEVVPVGVVRQLLVANQVEPRTASDFQNLARQLGVDAVVAGSITEYSPYYPPRMGLAVRWYAANPGFHEIPAGYGLPWGTPEEEYIPDELVWEAEFSLAREQLKTQTPEIDPSEVGNGLVKTTQHANRLAPSDRAPTELSDQSLRTEPDFQKNPVESRSISASPPAGVELPPDWPDASGLIPDPPRPVRPRAIQHVGPVMTHMRLYDGHDTDFTQALSSYYYFRDDARFGGWQGYLQRSDDFVRFCCHLHISEMLSARGGADKTRVVWRWPIGRYER